MRTNVFLNLEAQTVCAPHPNLPVFHKSSFVQDELLPQKLTRRALWN